MTMTNVTLTCCCLLPLSLCLPLAPAYLTIDFIYIGFVCCFDISMSSSLRH